MQPAVAHPKVSVVVPAYNEEATLHACLEPLLAQDYAGEIEVIVVDNNSTDRTAEVARSLGATVVPCLRKGVVHARDAGFRASTGELVLQTDADSVCPPDWVRRHVEALHAHPHAVASAGEVNYVDEPLWHRPLSSGSRLFKTLWYLVVRRPVTVFAANFAIWYTVLLAVGGYGTRLAHCADEKILLEKLLKEGPVLYTPSLRIKTSSRRFKGRWFRAIVMEMLLTTLLPVSLYFMARRWPLTAENRREKGVVVAAMPMVAVALTLVVMAVALHGYFVPNSQFFGRVHARQSLPDKLLALTFDDGPDPAFTEQVLGVLMEYGVEATFFLRGSSVEQYPDIARRIAEGGYEVGNHSWSHPMLASPARSRAELANTQALIEEVTGVRPTLFRPPYGRKTPWLLSEARKQQLTTVGWSVSAKDTKLTDPDAIARQVIKRAKPGSIVLLHDGVAGKPSVTDKSAVVAALPIIIEALQAEGYRFVTASELLAGTSAKVAITSAGTN